MIAGIHITETINLGVLLVTLALGLSTIVASVWGARNKALAESVAARADEAQKLLAVVEQARDDYKLRCEQLGAEKDDYAKEVAVLRNRPDWSEVVRMQEHQDDLAAKRQKDIAETMLSAISGQEARSQQWREQHDQAAERRNEAIIAGQHEMIAAIRRIAPSG